MGSLGDLARDGDRSGMDPARRQFLGQVWRGCRMPASQCSGEAAPSKAATPIRRGEKNRPAAPLLHAWHYREGGRQAPATLTRKSATSVATFRAVGFEKGWSRRIVNQHARRPHHPLRLCDSRRQGSIIRCISGDRGDIESRSPEIGQQTRVPPRISRKQGKGKTFSGKRLSHAEADSGAKPYDNADRLFH